MALIPLEEIARWEPTKQDFAIGNMLIISENHNPRSLPRLYSTLLYSILSVQERFARHKQIFNEFLFQDLFEPEEIIKRKDDVKKILDSYGKNSSKSQTIINSAKAWIQLSIRDKIFDDPDRLRGKELRKEMVDAMKGVGMKLASLTLRMACYENLAPIDSTTQQFIESRGFVYQKPLTSGKPQGLKNKAHEQYETKLEELAMPYDVSVALMQATIYAKLSSWKKDSGIQEIYTPLFIAKHFTV